jgi:hypothetical protein
MARGATVTEIARSDPHAAGALDLLHINFFSLSLKNGILQKQIRLLLEIV